MVAEGQGELDRGLVWAPEDQAGFDPRMAWAVEGAIALARTCPVLVVVVVLGGSRVVPRLSGGAFAQLS